MYNVNSFLLLFYLFNLNKLFLSFTTATKLNAEFITVDSEEKKEKNKERKKGTDSISATNYNF